MKSFILGKWIPFGLLFLNSLLIIPYPMLLLPTMMLFDAPGSTKNPFLALLSLAILSYPAPIIYAVITVWQNRKTYRSIDMWKMYAISYSGLLFIASTWFLFNFFCNGNTKACSYLP